MANKIKPVTSDVLAAAIIEGIQEKKGEHIVQLNLQGLDGAVTDYFIICQANSSTQINAIKDSIEVEVQKKLGEKPWHIEGTQNGEWVLLDYVNVVAHILNPEKRDFFNLEGLWADAKRKDIKAAN
ncbi:MAG: ribosome silencing factor [Bacteroidetes bacterium]|nr:MAG: ribosome silencing factor [Bacteroidota bacterium]MBL1144180.1 ribosome silencing factor [Bacteroidota bacterium]MCB0803546.1 ribosome silencing factor [Flavobacteriales bacterium]NOG56976.1 ribosome silencing factor [Bacteroidota bacterium]